jgi:hypothetical protein
MSKLWFKAKRYGWGWTPASTEGWVVTGLYIFFLIAWFFGQDPLDRSAGGVINDYLPRFIFLTGLFLLIAYKKGEKPTWNWGNRKSR